MSKGLGKRLLSLCLAVVLVFLLAACAGEGSGDETKEGEGKGGGNANSALAKEHVFAYEDLKLGDLAEGTNVNALDYIDGRIYLLLDFWLNQSIVPKEKAVAVSSDIAVEDVILPSYAQGRNVFRVVSVLPDGSDLKMYDLDTSIDENKSYDWLSHAMLGKDKAFAIANRTQMDDSDPQNVLYNNIQELICWGSDGAKLWTLDLTEYTQKDNTSGWINQLAMIEDGTIYAICAYGDMDPLKVVMIDQDGKIKQEKEFKPSATNRGNIYVKADGTLLVTSYNDNWNSLYGSTYDLNTGVEGKKTQLPDMLVMNGCRQGSVTDFVVTNEQGVFTCNLGDTEMKQVMNFINSDLDTNYVNHLLMLDEEHMVATYYGFDGSKLHISMMTKRDPKDIPDKRVLVLGANYLQYDVRQRIVEFNKTSSEYRIAVRDYSQYQTMDDYMAGYTQLNNDIIAGRMPDILVLDSEIDLDNYISKGLMADIGSLIKKDPELSKLQYMQSVFDAYSVDGKLYRLVSSFSVSTLVGKKSILGDKTGWNMDEFLQMAKGLKKGSSILGDLTRDNFFWQIMQYCGSDFIDASTGECSFDSPEFIKMLEFAKTLPETIEYDDDYWMTYESQYREDRTLLMPISMYDIRSMIDTINGYFGEDVTFMGFPNESRNGSIITANESYALSARSENLEGAWEFIRYYLTEEYQTGENLRWGFPVLKSAFMKKAEEATMRPYSIDPETGEKIEHDYYFYLNGESVVLEPLTQAQVDEIVEFVESVNRIQYYNSEVINLIKEDAAPFFAGHKTAEEVVKIIQNRVELYVNINR